MNSLQDINLLEFTIQLIEWTSKGITIFLKFNNPTLVSSGVQYDIINIQVLNGSNFKSANGEIAMNEYIDGYNRIWVQPQ